MHTQQDSSKVPEIRSGAPRKRAFKHRIRDREPRTAYVPRLSVRHWEHIVNTMIATLHKT